jgi:catechol 2,3-dioxygenase-like lactoylglutathione lyase family enzyme
MHHSAIHSIVIDCDDIEAGTAFWTAALGVKVRRNWDAFVILESPRPHLTFLLQQVPEPRTCKSRTHIDLGSDDVEAEVRRLEALGAKRISQHTFWWHMQDPCGNDFCVVNADDGDLPPEARTWE